MSSYTRKLRRAAAFPSAVETAPLCACCNRPMRRVLTPIAELPMMVLFGDDFLGDDEDDDLTPVDAASHDTPRR